MTIPAAYPFDPIIKRLQLLIRRVKPTCNFLKRLKLLIKRPLRLIILTILRIHPLLKPIYRIFIATIKQAMMRACGIGQDLRREAAAVISAVMDMKMGQKKPDCLISMDH